jgi:glycosyltransferase involved in cell wall biosynthesis
VSDRPEPLHSSLGSDPGAAAAGPPTVCVIIAVYNGARFVAAAIESVFAQTLQPAQVIVVDDGSTDDSADVVRSCPYADRITLVQQANAGQSAARNAGLELVTSEFVAFLDQDDLWYPGHLAALVPLLADPSIGWAYSDFDEIDGAGQLVTRGFHRAHGLGHPRLSLADLIGEDLMVLPTATVVRTSAIRDAGGFDVTLTGYEDDDLFIRLFRRHSLPAYDSASTVQFRVHAGSSSMSASFGASRLRFLDKLQATVPDNVRLNRYYVRDLVVPRLLRTTLSEYLTCLMHGNDAEALVLARLATDIAARSRLTVRRRVGLFVLRRPAACRFALRCRAMLPRAFRRRMLAGLTYP